MTDTSARTWNQDAEVRNGVSDFGVWRPSEGRFYVISSKDGHHFTQDWGQAGDVPIAGNYDGDKSA